MRVFTPWWCGLGLKPVWRMKTSSSRTDSPIETDVSLSENFLTVHLVRGMPRRLATCSASSGCELPDGLVRGGEGQAR